MVLLKGTGGPVPPSKTSSLQPLQSSVCTTGHRLWAKGKITGPKGIMWDQEEVSNKAQGR